MNKELCKECNHELCENCKLCHNMDCARFYRPFNKCFDLLLPKKGEAELVGDFSSFDLGCPVKECGWYFQTKEDLANHIKEGKHGVDGGKVIPNTQ